MNISIVILHNHQTTDISEYLSKLNNQAKDKQIEKIVIRPPQTQTDNHKQRDCFYIDLPTDFGTAQSFNIGIKKALESSPEYIWLLETNTEPVASSLEMFYEAGQRMRTKSLFGCKLVLDNENMYSAGGQLDWQQEKFKSRGMGETDKGQFDGDIDMDYFETKCLFIRAQAFDIGLFDGKIFKYGHDIDFCIRANKAGYKIQYLGNIKAKVKEDSEDQIQLKEYFTQRNYLLLMTRYAGIFAKYSAIKKSYQNYRLGRPWQRRAVKDFIQGTFGRGSYQPT